MQYGLEHWGSELGLRVDIFIKGRKTFFVKDMEKVFTNWHFLDNHYYHATTTLDLTAWK